MLKYVVTEEVEGAVTPGGASSSRDALEACFRVTLPAKLGVDAVTLPLLEPPKGDQHRMAGSTPCPDLADNSQLLYLLPE